MKTFSTSKELGDYISIQKKEGLIVGFVPTMGALHKGHISLVEYCRQLCDITVVSIFVNPTQFNDKGDLERYPRMPDVDAKLLADGGCDILFLPTEQEIYPERDTRIFDFGQLDKVMEGAHRAGHFNGVAQVVSRLFDIVKPHKAFFGLKDFQQLAIVRDMVRQLKFDIEIVAVPIVRDTDGLALSSRNMLLNEAQRRSAPRISKILFEAKEKVKEMSVADLKEWVINSINKDAELEVEYFDIVDADTLLSINTWGDANEVFACIAVQVGKIRLIDNLRLL